VRRWVVILGLGLTGCSVGAHAPGYVSCKGKGQITGSGAVAMVYGGGNTFNLQIDCGDGLEFRQGSERETEATK